MDSDTPLPVPNISRPVPEPLTFIEDTLTTDSDYLSEDDDEENPTVPLTEANLEYHSKFGGDCPFCDGKRMINSKTSKDFPTCFHCRFKCPNFTSCGGYRGLSSTHYRYPKCSKCKYGDLYKTPKTEKKI